MIYIAYSRLICKKLWCYKPNKLFCYTILAIERRQLYIHSCVLQLEHQNSGQIWPQKGPAWHLMEILGHFNRCKMKRTLILKVQDLSHLIPICPKLKSTLFPPGMSYLTSKLGQIVAPRQNVLKLILKSPRFVTFGANLTQFGCRI